MTEFDITSAFGARARRPLVIIAVKPDDEKAVAVQLAPADALRIADQIRNAAMAALADAAMVRLWGEDDPERIGVMLAALRHARATIDEQEGTGDR